MTWRARDSRGHYLASKDVHTTLGPEDWDDTCRHQPATHEMRPSLNSFGHQPIDEYEGTPEGDLGVTNVVCERCMAWTYWKNVGFWVGVRVAWPCTSAIVLGLVPRPCSYCKGARCDPDDPGDWISEVGMHNPYSAAPCPECHGTGHQAVGEQWPGRTA
jgi:hypothetical protein